MVYYKLNDGNKIPKLGIGMYVLTPEQAEESVYNALKIGYRLIDTANVYMNEKGVGRGIKRAINEGIVKREDIFVTSKLWPTDYAYEDAKKAIDETLKRLDLDYIDLLLLHQQYGEYLDAYRAMEHGVKAGKIKSIGLSDFNAERFQKVVENATIIPAVHQIETHPYYPEHELRELAKKTNTIIESWFPLGGIENKGKLLNNEIIKGIADKYNKTNAQVILRWHLQMGYIAIPGSSNKEHIEENFNIFDFELSDEDMNEMKKVDSETRFFTMSEEEQEKMFTGFAPDFNSQK